MIIGKIAYINLLPFHLFLKRYLRNSSDRSAWQYHKGVPSDINRKFQTGRVEAAVISSIFSSKYRCSDFGIVADKKVLSVLSCPGEYRADKASNTSNILAKILNAEGEIVIGDRALHRRKNGACKDLAELWYKKYRLPFVFARFCYRKNAKQYEKLAKNFLASHIKIPTYILKRYVKQSGLSQKEIKNYLTYIRYNIGIKEQYSLHKFLRLAKRKKYRR